MSKRLKARPLWIVTVAGVVIAGILAATALAFTDTYCSGCTIGNVPAVSNSHHFNDNHSSTAQAKKQHIYYYHAATDLTSCSLSSGSTQVIGLNYDCTSGVSYYNTARCHLLNDGTVSATCWANYNPD